MSFLEWPFAPLMLRRNQFRGTDTPRLIHKQAAAVEAARHPSSSAAHWSTALAATQLVAHDGVVLAKSGRPDGFAGGRLPRQLARHVLEIGAARTYVAFGQPHLDAPWRSGARRRVSFRANDVRSQFQPFLQWEDDYVVNACKNGAHRFALLAGVTLSLPANTAEPYRVLSPSGGMSHPAVLLVAPGPTGGSVPGHARIRCPILATEPFDTIRSRFQLEIDIGVGHLVVCGPVADDDKGGILFCEI